MRSALATAVSFAAVTLISWACTTSSAPAANENAGSAIPAKRAAAPGASKAGVIAGFAFVDSAVTTRGSRSKVPPGTKIYPPGSKITGTTGCPTTRYQTDGLLVVVIDYNGRPTAGSIQVTRHPESGGQFENAPYYLDLDSGRIMQMLGPIFENGTYDVKFTYDFSLGSGETTSASIVLARNCPAPG
jgi:hypothetical protein